MSCTCQKSITPKKAPGIYNDCKIYPLSILFCSKLELNRCHETLTCLSALRLGFSTFRAREPSSRSQCTKSPSFFVSPRYMCPCEAVTLRLDSSSVLHVSWVLPQTHPSRMTRLYQILARQQGRPHPSLPLVQYSRSQCRLSFLRIRGLKLCGEYAADEFSDLLTCIPSLGDG